MFPVLRNSIRKGVTVATISRYLPSIAMSIPVHNVADDWPRLPPKHAKMYDTGNLLDRLPTLEQLKLRDQVVYPLPYWTATSLSEDELIKVVDIQQALFSLELQKNEHTPDENPKEVANRILEIVGIEKTEGVNLWNDEVWLDTVSGYTFDQQDKYFRSVYSQTLSGFEIQDECHIIRQYTIPTTMITMHTHWPDPNVGGIACVSNRGIRIGRAAVLNHLCDNLKYSPLCSYIIAILMLNDSFLREFVAKNA